LLAGRRAATGRALAGGPSAARLPRARVERRGSRSTLRARFLGENFAAAGKGDDHEIRPPFRHAAGAASEQGLTGYAGGVTRRFDSIRTERLVMRRWRDADRAPYAALNADHEVMRYFPAPLTRGESDASVDRIEALFERQGFGLWALEVAETGEFIGFTGLNPMPDGVPGAGGMEVGWRLARHAWHRGYATEAATASAGVAFDGAGLDQIWSMTAVINRPSQAVMLRLGMTPHELFDHPALMPGHPLRRHIAYRMQRPGGAPPGMAVG
jgi:RimJ/RimL family protein N-acetyltransferase